VFGKSDAVLLAYQFWMYFKK